MRRFLLPEIIDWCLRDTYGVNGTDLEQIVLDRLLEYITSHSVTITTVTEEDIMEYLKTKATKVVLNSPEDNVNLVPAAYITGPGVYFNMYGDVWRPILNDVNHMRDYCMHLEKNMCDVVVSLASDEFFLKDLKDYYGESVFLAVCTDLIKKLGVLCDLEKHLSVDSFLSHLHEMLLSDKLYLDYTVINKDELSNYENTINYIDFHKDGIYFTIGYRYWVYLCKDSDEFKEYIEFRKPLEKDAFYEGFNLEVF